MGDMDDGRTQLESLASQIERRLGELGEAAPAHERARAEMLVEDARQAAKEEGPQDRIGVLAAELQQLERTLLARETPAGEPGGVSAGSGRSQPVDAPADDVVDADFRPS
jgi:molecular chaperone DnaK